MAESLLLARKRSPAMSAFLPVFAVERTFVRQAEIDANDPGCVKTPACSGWGLR